jgi:hypothetical protein
MAKDTLPKDVVEAFHNILAKLRSQMWSNEQHIMDQVATFISSKIGPPEQEEEEE